MNENIRLFIERLSHDSALQTRIIDSETPEEAYAVALSVQAGFTKEEFLASSADIEHAIRVADLSIDDVIGVTGGLTGLDDGFASQAHEVSGMETND